MEIFILRPDANNFANVVFSDEERQWEWIYRFDGSPLKNGWKPLKVDIIQNMNGLSLPLGDFASFHSHMPVFGKKATEILRSNFEQDGEFLPLTCSRADLYLFNVTSLTDALDETASKIVYLSGGKILTVEKPRFVLSRLVGVNAFRIRQLPLGNIYVTDKFVKLIEKFHLSGFLFDPV